MSAPQSYYVPVDAGEAEFTEKRSRFLGHVRRVETEAEARAFLDEMRKKYYDARHNCWCYIIRGGELQEKRTLKLPERIRGVLRCKNPRCITSVEQELPQIFTLTDEETRTYRCLYCETKAEK